ncbi:hypothetical protein P3G55_25685, partial [Leptospira sp. 96542]|nr:hypothetical protein [Leptospira sp. 96542]
MTLAFRPLHLLRSPRARRRPYARLVAAALAAVLLSQQAGCAAQLWPPSSWSLSMDLPFLNRQPVADTATAPTATPTSSGPKDLDNAAEALDYAETLCGLPPEALDTEIERLQALEAQGGQTALRAQQLAFAHRLARQLASMHAEQQRLQDANEQQAQLLREHQKRIEQL